MNQIIIQPSMSSVNVPSFPIPDVPPIISNTSSMISIQNNSIMPIHNNNNMMKRHILAGSTYAQSDGSYLWRQLHERAVNYIESNGNDQPFIDIWGRSIPRYLSGCACHEFYVNWIRQDVNKPDYKNRESYFNWTVKLHNAVNAKLNKPIVDYENAKKIWNFI